MQSRAFYQSARFRQSISALAAALFYGSWAAWVNWPEGPATALRLAVIHGTYAGLLTFISAGLMELSYRVLSSHRHLRPHRWGLSFGLCNGFAFGVAAAINALAGNPSVALTILPGMLLGTLFSASYLRLLTLSEAKSGNMSR